MERERERERERGVMGCEREKVREGNRERERERETSNEINRVEEGGKRMMDFHRGAHITTMESFGVT